MGVASSDGEESDDEDEAEGTETMNTTLTEGTGEREGVTGGLHENSVGSLLLHVYTNPKPVDLDPAERSMVEQYEHRLAAKRQEMIELQRQRDELRKTHARLVLLQSQILTPKVLV